MNESIPLGPLNIALIEDAAKDLEDFSEQIMAPGRLDGGDVALCVGCWRPIMAPQLGVEPCPGARREKRAEYLT